VVVQISNNGDRVFCVTDTLEPYRAIQVQIVYYRLVLAAMQFAILLLLSQTAVVKLAVFDSYANNLIRT